MAIFVTGASGHIGLAVAHELAWAGHEVRGLVRTDVGAQRVATHEIEPVLGGLADLELLARAAGTHEVTVHCAVDHGPDRWALETAALDAMIADAREARRPRLLIYTSGVWVYGTTGARAATEADTPPPPAMVARRLEVEAQVLAAAGGNLTTAVVRPGCVYGGGGSLTAAWFAAAAAGGPVPVVDGDNRWAMVHRADVASLYRALIEQHRGGVWNCVDGSRDTTAACAAAAHRALGGAGDVLRLTLDEGAARHGALAACLAFDQHVSADKARRELGWRPAHAGFVAEARRLARSWRAHA